MRTRKFNLGDTVSWSFTDIRYGHPHVPIQCSGIVLGLRGKNVLVGLGGDSAQILPKDELTVIKKKLKEVV